MSTAPVCIEITDRYLRVAQFTSGFGGKTLVKSMRKQILGEQDIPRAAAEFIVENFPDTSAIYMNAPARSLFARELRVPFLEARKVKDILPFELEAQLPYEQDEIIFGGYHYPNQEYKDTNIVVCGTLRSAIEPFVIALEERQLPLTGFYAVQDAVFCLTGDLHEEVAISIFIGESTSLVTVSEAGKLKTSRIISHGYLAIAKKLAKRMNIKMEEGLNLLTELPDIFAEEPDYEFLEKQFKVTKLILKELQKNFDHEITIIAREIEVTARSVGFTSKDPVPLTLLTDCPFRETLEQRVALKTHYTAQSFPYADTPLADFGTDNTLLFGGILAMTESRQINLLQGDLKKRALSSAAGRRLSNIINMSAAILAIIFSVLLSYSSKKVQIDQAKVMQQEVFEKSFGLRAKENTSAISQARELVEKERKKTEIFRLFFSSQSVSDLLVNVHRSIPMGTQFEVEMMRYDNNTLALSASCGSFTELNTIKESLMASPLLEKVETSREKATPGAGGQNRIKFQMMLTPKKPEGV
jgi:hypothetical protein